MMLREDSKLSPASCTAVARWARDGTPLPERAQQEIRALAKSEGAEDPLPLLTKSQEEMHLHRAASIVRRINEGTAEVKDLALRTEIWQWRLADRRHQEKKEKT